MRAPALTAALLVALAAPAAGAATTLCVEVRSDDAALGAGLRKLVLDEVAHYPSHSVVDRDWSDGRGSSAPDPAGAAPLCASRLAVELFQLAGQRYITARVNREVPVRFGVGKDNLAERLAAALRLALRNDPVHLATDPRELSAVQRAAHSILRRGHTRVRLELFQAIAGSDRGATFAPGGALALTRGADHWFVTARAYGGGMPGGVAADGRALRVQAGADVGLGYELAARTSTSPYAALALGAQYLRYEGRPAATAASVESVDKLGFAFSARLGLRLFRVNNFDCDLFAVGYLPLFRTKDPDSDLIDRYTPSLQLGLGVGF